jgi:hypothetical protein
MGWGLTCCSAGLDSRARLRLRPATSTTVAGNRWRAVLDEAACFPDTGPPNAGCPQDDRRDSRPLLLANNLRTIVSQNSPKTVILEVDSMELDASACLNNRIISLRFVTCAASESCGNAQLGQGHGLCSCEKRAAGRYLLISLPRCMLPDGLEAASIHDQEDFPGCFNRPHGMPIAVVGLEAGWIYLECRERVSSGLEAHSSRSCSV